MVPEPESSYLVATAYANQMQLVKLLAETDCLGWSIQQEEAQVKNPEESSEYGGTDFTKTYRSPKGDILVTMSRNSKYVVIWSISREEIKAVDKLKLCDEGVEVRDIECFTKSDLFAFIRSDSSVGIANFRTREIVATVSGKQTVWYCRRKVSLNSDDTRLAVVLERKLLVYSLSQDSSVTATCIFEHEDKDENGFMAAQFSPHDPNVLAACSYDKVYLWDLQQMVARENNDKAESQIDSSSSNPLRWSFDIEGGRDISFHPTDSNRLEVSTNYDTHAYNVDDGCERPDEKMKGERMSRWSKDGAVRIASRNRDLIWTHCKSKNSSRLQTHEFNNPIPPCFVEEKNDSCAK